MDDKDALAGHLQEVRRGTVVLACLWILTTPSYGYALLQQCEQYGVPTDANTLYPLLRRLEKQGYLTSTWDTTEPRPRKFYTTSPAGRRVAEALLAEQRSLDDAITNIVTTHASGGRGKADG